jgi:hypothetical protein
VGQGNPLKGPVSDSYSIPVRYRSNNEFPTEVQERLEDFRDHSNASMLNSEEQVMLFSDRLEVWNPGTLPPSLTLEMLRGPQGSGPANPLLAELLYLTKYIERMGTGTGPPDPGGCTDTHSPGTQGPHSSPRALPDPGLGGRTDRADPSRQAPQSPAAIPADGEGPGLVGGPEERRDHPLSLVLPRGKKTP